MQDSDLSPMDTSSVSRFLYRKIKPVGKVRRRVQEVRNPLSFYDDLMTSRQTLDLSHNEGARLAADSLLSQGLQGYQEVLDTEGEVDFLSELEKTYILQNGNNGSTGEPHASDDTDKDSNSFTQCPETSTDSENTFTGLNQSSLKDGTTVDHVSNEYKIYFQSDSKSAGMKDLVRGFIRKAGLALAIVMDSFTDVELLCDLLEASRKRNVSIYLLLDHLNLGLFVSMWQELKLDSKNFPKLSVRSVAGQTYCAKTGRKLIGQVNETFIISDWTEVLTGSYSFSWLTGHVHRSLVIYLKGNNVVPFRQEFQRLYSSSNPVCDFVNYTSLPCAHPFFTLVHSAQGNNTAASKSEERQIISQRHRDLTEEAENTRILEKSEIQSFEMESSKGETQPLHTANTDTNMQLDIKPLRRPLQNGPLLKMNKTVKAVCTLQDEKKDVQPPGKNPNQVNTAMSHIQSYLKSLTITNSTERNTKAHEDQRPAWYQSTRKTMLNPTHHTTGTDGLVLQQRGRDSLTKPQGGMFSGLNTKRHHWNYSLSVKPNMDFVSKQSPSASQQKQANTAQQFSLSNLRGQNSGLQVTSPVSSRKDQPPLFPHSDSSASRGRPPKPLLQSDSTLFPKAAGARRHPQPLPSQQGENSSKTELDSPESALRTRTAGSPKLPQRLLQCRSEHGHSGGLEAVSQQHECKI